MSMTFFFILELHLLVICSILLIHLNRNLPIVCFLFHFAHLENYYLLLAN